MLEKFNKPRQSNSGLLKELELPIDFNISQNEEKNRKKLILDIKKGKFK